MSRAMRNWAVGFYWIGAAMALASLVLILARNSELLWPFEHRVVPLSWAIGGGSILAFLAYELLPASFPRSRDAEGRSSQPDTDWETLESVEAVESFKS